MFEVSEHVNCEKLIRACSESIKELKLYSRTNNKISIIIKVTKINKKSKNLPRKHLALLVKFKL